MTRIQKRRRARVAQALRRCHRVERDQMGQTRSAAAYGASWAYLDAVFKLTLAERLAGERPWPKRMTGGTVRVYR